MYLPSENEVLLTEFSFFVLSGVFSSLFCSAGAVAQLKKMNAEIKVAIVVLIVSCIAV
jgi:hypothetical protein